VGKVEILLGGQIVNDRTDPFEVSRHPYVIDILRKGVGYPLLHVPLFRKIIFTKWVLPIGGFSSLNNREMSVNSYGPVIKVRTS
jgi:hypothetical protein